MKYLAACCTAKNEAPYILEWISFHRAVGFEHIIIIDHGSTDGMAEVIESFEDRKSVTIVPWLRSGSQIDMMNWVLATFRDKFFWCAFIDCDEYLYPLDMKDIRNLLVNYEPFGAVGVHWLIYGSSGFLRKQEGLTIQKYVLRSREDFLYNRHVKCIVKMQTARAALTSHIFDTKDGVVDENLSELPLMAPHGFFENRLPTFNRLRVNHYHTRSRQEYDIKAARGFFGIDDDKLRDVARRAVMFDQHDRNEVKDRSALNYEKMTLFYMGSAAPSLQTA